MLKRILTGAVGLPIVIGLVYIGGLAVVAACFLLAVFGLRELYIALNKKHRPIFYIGYVFAAVYFAVLYFFGTGYLLLIVLLLFIISVHLCMVVFFNRVSLYECLSVVYGFFYVPFLMAFFVLVREHEMGQYYVWLIFTSAFGADTFAYIVGSALGKRKLKNSPSPSKSVEGLIGGVLGAAFLGFLYGLFMGVLLNTIIISVLGAVFSVVGDLAASAVKRRTDLKDFGNVFPGHGGVLDRIDSTLVVAPVVFVVMSVMS